MIRAGFLSPEDRAALIALARDGSAVHRFARRANALVLLDAGWNCEQVALALLLDDDTVRKWHSAFVTEGLNGLTRFEVGGSACQLNDEQQQKLKAWVAASLPRTTRQVGVWIEQEFGLVYESRSGLIALLHRLDLAYHKPNVIPRKLDEEKQKAFIASYEELLNSLADNEAVLFADAVHPVRPVGAYHQWRKIPPRELSIALVAGKRFVWVTGWIGALRQRPPLGGRAIQRAVT